MIDVVLALCNHKSLLLYMLFKRGETRCKGDILNEYKVGPY